MRTHNAKLRLRCAFGIMSKHVRHLTNLMVSEVTVTKSNEYQSLRMPNALILSGPIDPVWARLLL